MFNRKAALIAGIGYLRKRPGELLHAARRARHLRLAIPIAALKWLATELTTSSGGARDVRIASSPPGLRVDATVEQMGTLIRATCVLLVERVTVGADSLEMELRLRDVALELLDEGTQTPLAALIRSRTLDLSRVASLVAYLPSRPSALIDAMDDRLVFDLMKVPQISQDARVHTVLRLVSGILAVDDVCVNQDHLEIGFHPLLSGVKALISRNS